MSENVTLSDISINNVKVLFSRKCFGVNDQDVR